VTATVSPIATTSGYKTLTNRLPVRVAAEKQKRSLIATVFWIASAKAPQDLEKKVPSLCGCRIVDSDSDFGNDGVLECRDDCPTIIGKPVPGSVRLRRSVAAEK
jgi:hypothetical protein